MSMRRRKNDSDYCAQGYNQCYDPSGFGELFTGWWMFSSALWLLEGQGNWLKVTEKVNQVNQASPPSVSAKPLTSTGKALS